MSQIPSPTHPDEGAFACVAVARESHEGELWRFLRHQLPDGHAAEDLLQDVFVKAMRQGQGFCSLDNPRAWLFQVARNAMIDRARLSKVHVPLDESALDIPAPVLEATAPVDALAGCMARVLGELPPDDAAILRACDLEGQTQREFAELSDISLAAVKSRLLRARQRLRVQLTAACQVRFDDDGNVSGHVPRPPVTD
jgi:RNA polymerase sigma-70 factor (ECF subfamily)